MFIRPDQHEGKCDCRSQMTVKNGEDEQSEVKWLTAVKRSQEQGHKRKGLKCTNDAKGWCILECYGYQINQPNHTTQYFWPTINSFEVNSHQGEVGRPYTQEKYAKTKSHDSTSVPSCPRTKCENHWKRRCYSGSVRIKLLGLLSAMHTVVFTVARSRRSEWACVL